MAQFNTPFIDDEEKMKDFYILSKDEFLASYSYLTEEEYDATYREVYGNKEGIKLQKFKLPVCWEVSAIIEVEAESLEDAIDYFDANLEHIPLPRKFEYSEGSFDLSCREYSYLELLQSYKLS